VVIVGLGVVVSRAARRVEHAEWINRTLVQRRLDVYDRMFPPLNDLYVFFRCVGHFRDLSPLEALARKRDADALFHRNRFLMSADFDDAYNRFMDTCFKTNTGPGRGAQLRASVDWHRRERPRWDDTWDILYVSNTEDVRSAGTLAVEYENLMHSFGNEIGVNPSARRTSG
jgi:hypothetical protein